MHYAAFHPGQDPAFEVDVCRNFEVIPTTKKSKKYPKLELHWVEIFQSGNMKDWMRPERPPLPPYYFDPPWMKRDIKKIAA